MIPDKAVRAAAAKIAGPTIWAEQWRRPHYENIALSALTAAAPHLEAQDAYPPLLGIGASLAGGAELLERQTHALECAADAVHADQLVPEKVPGALDVVRTAVDTYLAAMRETAA